MRFNDLFLKIVFIFILSDVVQLIFGIKYCHFSDDCGYGGICETLSGKPGVCKCPSLIFYDDETCSIVRTQCVNWGLPQCMMADYSNCVNIFGAFYCICRDGYRGTRCQYETEKWTKLKRVTVPYLAYIPKQDALERQNLLVFIEHLGNGFFLQLIQHQPRQVHATFFWNDFKKVDNARKLCLDVGIYEVFCRFVPSRSLFAMNHVFYVPYDNYVFGAANKVVEYKYHLNIFNLIKTATTPKPEFATNIILLSVGDQEEKFACTPTISLTNCAADGKNMVSYFRSHSFNLQVKINSTSSCKVKSVHHVWNIYKVNYLFSSVVDKEPFLTKNGGHGFRINRYQLPVGMYRVDVVANSEILLNEITSRWNFQYCFFIIKEAPIKAIIKGGYDRKVSILTKKLIFDASESYNPNEVYATRKDLTYSWTVCFYLSDGSCSTEYFVQKFDPIFIPDITFKVGDVIKVTLVAVSPKDKRKSRDEIQMVTIVSEPVTELFIFCLRNCGFHEVIANPNEIVFLEARTVTGEGKHGTDKYDWNWSVTDLIFGKPISIDDIREPKHYRGGEPPGEANIIITMGSLPIRQINASIIVENVDSENRRFDISAVGFHSQNPYFFLEYEIYERGKNGSEPDVLLGFNTVGKLSNVYLKTGRLYVKICDGVNGICITVEKTVQVSIKKPNEGLIQTLIHEIRELRNNENLEGVVLNIIAITNMLDFAKNKSETIATLVQEVTELPFYEYFIRIKQYSTIIGRLIVKGGDISSSQKVERMLLNVDRLLSVGNFVKKISFYLVELTRISLGVDSDVTTEQLKDVALDLMYGIEVISSTRERIVDYTEKQEYSKQLIKCRELSEVMDTAIKSIGTFLSEKLIPGQKEITFELQSVSIWIKVDNIMNLSNFNIPSPSNKHNTSIKIPESLARKLSEKSDIFVLNVYSLVSDPVSWNPLNKKPNSDILLIYLSYRKDIFTTVEIREDLSESFDLFMDLHNVTRRTISGTVSLPSRSASDAIKDKAVVVHRLKSGEKILEGSGVGGLITLKFINVTNDHHLRIVLTKNFRPDYYMLVNNPLTVGKSHDYFEITTTADDPDTKYYIGIMPGKLAQENDSVAYKFEIHTYECQTWYDNQWRSDMCAVITKSPFTNSIHCQCHHLSRFGGLTLITPNRIDPINDAKLFMTVFQNPYVVGLVSFILVFYFLTLIWTCYKDKVVKINARIIHLEDNVPGDRCPYIVVIYTGSRMSCSTTARVCFQIIGEKSNSRVHFLKCQWRKILTQGADDWFLIFSPSSLGNLLYFHIWQDFSGKSPSWYCIEIIVIDVVERKRYIFILGKWLTVLLPNCRLEYKVIAEDRPEVEDRSVIAENNIAVGLREGHVWVGVFAGHPRSNFLRSERLTVGVFALLNTMLISIMFYDVKNPVQMDLSEYRYDLKDWIISFEVTLIVMPITLSMVFLFKKSKTDVIEGEDDIRSDRISISSSVRQRSGASSQWSGSSVNEPTPTSNQETNNFNEIRSNIIYKFLYNYVTHYMSVDPLLPFAITLSDYSRKKVIGWFILAWVFCISVILVESYFLMLYGLTFGAKKSLKWLTSVLFSSIEDSLITEPFFIVLFAILLAYIFKKPHEFGKYEIVNEREFHTYSYKNSDRKDVKNFLQKERLKEHYKPIPLEKVEKLRTIHCRNWNNKSMIFDLTILVIFVILFFIFVLKMNKNILYFTSLHLEKLLFHKKSDHSVGWYNVSTEFQLWYYLIYELIPALHITVWYNGSPLEPQDEEYTGFTEGYFEKLVGVPRIRQQRVKISRKCSIDDRLNKYFITCHQTSLTFAEDHKTYNGSWKKLASKDIVSASSEWKYQTPEETQTVGMWGKSGSFYDGGGYLAILSNSRLRSIAILSELDQHDWMDQFTKVVFIELVLYNVYTNVFSLVILIAEHHSSEIYITRTQVHSVILKDSLDFETWIGMVTILIILIIMACRVYYLMSLYGFCNFFTRLRNISKFAIAVLGLILIVLLIAQSVLNVFYAKYIKDAASHDFISYYHPVYTQRLINSFLALLALFIVLQVIFINRSDLKTKILQKSLEFSFNPIIIVCFILLSIVVLFNSLLILLQNPCIANVLLINSFNFRQMTNSLMFPDKIVLPFLLTILFAFVLMIIRVFLIYNYTVANYHMSYHVLYCGNKLIQKSLFKISHIKKANCLRKNISVENVHDNNLIELTDSQIRAMRKITLKFMKKL